MVISALWTHPRAPLAARATHGAGPTAGVPHEPEEANHPANEPGEERFPRTGPVHDAPYSVDAHVSTAGVG